MVIAYTLFVLAVGGSRTDRKMAVSQRNLAWSRTRGGQELGRGTIRPWWHCTLACWSDAWSRRSIGRSCPLWGGRWWPGCWPPRHCAGGASHARAGNGIPASSSSPMALATQGPYRCLPHPNYVAVVVEGIALPLVHTAWVTAVTFTVLNAVVLQARIGVDKRAALAGLPMIDLLVAGGGPAGLATAILGARAGLEVVVVERRRGPVDKACGEGLMPHAVALLGSLGVDAPGKPFHGITYVDDGHRVTGRFRGGAGRGVRRTALHAGAVGGGDGGRCPD